MDDLSVKIKYSLDGNSSAEVIKQTKKLEEELQKTPIQLKIEANTGIASQEMSKVAKNYEQVWEKAFYNQRTMALKTADDIKNAYNTQYFDNFNKSIGIGTTNNNSAKASASVFEDLFNKSEKTTVGMSKLEKQIVSLNPQIETMNHGMDMSAQSMSGMITKFAEWYIIGGLVSGLFNELGKSVKFVDDLNKSMTNISMVTGLSHDKVTQMTQDYVNLALQLHDTVLNVSKASEEFLRAGHTQDETLALIKSSTVMSKISGEDQKATADQLIAITNAYGIESSKTMDIVDKLTTVDNNSATSTKELGQALERTSASAQMAGVSFNNLVSYIATISSVTRKSATSIGESFKTIFARMQDINQRKSTDQYGEDISNVEKSLRQVGIQLRDTKDSFKPMSQVLDETAKKWSTLTQLQQADVAKSIAGVRQRENFIVLMTHYNDALKLQGQMTDSSGSAMSRYGEFAKSTEARINDLTNAFQKLSMQLIHSETINSVLSGLTNFVTGVGRVTSAIGGLNTVLLIVIPLISIKFLSSLYSAAAGAGLLETATVALSLGVKGLATSLLALLSNPVTWLIAGITAVATLIPIWINHQQELKKQTEETTKAQDDLNTALKGFNSGLDTAKITAATTAIENLKNAIKFDDKVQQIQALEKEISDLVTKIAADKAKMTSTGDTTAFQQDTALLGKARDKLAELQNQLGTVTEATTQYNKAVLDSVDKTKTQLGTYDTILKEVADGHKFTAEEANKLIATDSNLSQAFKINGDSATVNADAIKNLKSSAIDQAITAVNSSISQTKTIISNSIDRTNAYVLEANSLSSLADMWNAINSVTNGYGNANDAGINSGSIAQIQKNYKPLMDLYSTLDDLNKLKGSVSGAVDTSGGFTSTPSGSSKKSSEPATESKSVYESYIRSTRELYNQSKAQEAIIQQQLTQAKNQKNTNLELLRTNELITNNKDQISKLNASTSSLKQEYYHQLSNFPQFDDPTQWIDSHGDATLKYIQLFNSSSKKTQEQMTDLFDRISQVRKAWSENDSTIQTLITTQQTLNQTLSDTRATIADSTITAIKNAYTQEKEIFDKGIDHQIQAEQDRHDLIISHIDEEISKLDQQVNANDYNKNLTKSQTEAQDIQNQINALMLDNSPEAVSKRIDLQKQLADKTTAIQDMQQKHDLELRKQNLNDQKKSEDTKLKTFKDTLTDQKTAQDLAYENMINDEKYFANLRVDIINGSLDKVRDKLKELQSDLAKTSKTIADSIGVDFSKLTTAMGGLTTSGSALNAIKPQVTATGVDASILQAQYGNTIDIVSSGGSIPNQAGLPGSDRISTNLLYQKLLGAPKNNISTDQMWKFDKGGETSNTGLHWLDGKLGKPERILSTDQNVAWNKLSENILPITNVLDRFMTNFKMPSFTPNLSKMGGNLKVVNNVAFSGTGQLTNSDLNKIAEFLDSRTVNEMKKLGFS